MSFSSDFEAFFKKNYSSAYYLALSIVHDEEASRDIVADSFEYLFAHSEDFSDSERRNYLYVIVRNKCADHYRKKTVRDNYAEYVIHTAKKGETGDWQEHEMMVEQVMEAINELTPRTREIITAHYIGRKKYYEVAEDLGISESAVKKHIMQALRFLRTKFVK